MTSCFIIDLKDDIRLDVKMFKPKTLFEAIGLARLQDEQLATKKSQSQSEFGVPPFSGPTTNGSPVIKDSLHRRCKHVVQKHYVTTMTKCSNRVIYAKRRNYT